ncbi:MAG TPA: IclR family transcriptional regulator [Hyphomicrobiales bacterium]|nr:IclR family transcriptional regulator [Hyphomicrobiales bacterium]
MLTDHEGDSHFAITLARGLELLHCFTADEPVLGNSELAARTGLARSTVSRFAYTLTCLGHLQVDRRSGKYQLGPAVLSLSYPLLATVSLRQVARGLMQELADQVGGSVSIGIRDRLQIIYVETSRCRSIHSRQLSDIGMSHPIARSAIGRAYLAACDPEARTALLNEIAVKAPEQLENLGNVLDRSFVEFGERGFCASFGHVRSDIHAVGVPLRIRTTGEIYAFNCVVPAFLLRPGQLVEDIGPRLAAMVRSLGLG